MDTAYKVLINKALERYHFETCHSGTATEAIARESLNKALVHLCNVAFFTDDQEAFTELGSLVTNVQCGEYIKPYNLMVTI
ncbi:DUF4754 family protein [Escherichia coli]|nr:DUF4754 family protein [Escherichia coli]